MPAGTEYIQRILVFLQRIPRHVLEKCVLLQQMDNLTKQEKRFYAAAWVLVFVLVSAAILIPRLSSHSMPFFWNDLFRVWLSILPFLLLFVGHDTLAIPFLQKKKTLPYLLVSVGLLALFILYLVLADRTSPGPQAGPPMGAFPERDVPPPPGRRMPLNPEIMKGVIAVLVMGVNVGVKSFFNMLRNERKMQELKAETLNQRLETLRFQINPHFFMNTLNNIHALVDIDPEKAKESIEEFSKLMRIVLYDGNAPTIPLQRELDFLGHYVSLMRLRYPESVRITLSQTGVSDGAEVPPLLMASFVENAFKHGISYEAPSFVDVSVEVRERQIVFKCVNSRHPEKEDGRHGLGLDNIRNRLNLLYADAYTLDIDEQPERYAVLLILPEREAAV